jgi:hypothetical protein
MLAILLHNTDLVHGFNADKAYLHHPNIEQVYNHVYPRTLAPWTTTMEPVTSDTCLQQHQNANLAAWTHISTTASEGQADTPPNIPPSFPSSQALEFAPIVLRLPHCGDDGSYLPFNDGSWNPLGSNLAITTTDHFPSFATGLSVAQCLEPDQSLMLVQETNIFSTPDTAFENLDLTDTSLVTPNYGIADFYNASIGSYIGPLGEPSAIALDPWIVDALPEQISIVHDQCLRDNHGGQYQQDTTQDSTSSIPTDAIISSSSGSPIPDPDQWLPEDLHHIGFQDSSRDWRCKYPSCVYDKTFLRACDLRKHYRSHLKTFFCDHSDCTGSVNGFSSRKDWQRHKRSHDPHIMCLEPGCGKMFGRVDNMRAHYEKIHRSARNSVFPRRCRRSSKRVKDQSQKNKDSSRGVM